MAVMMSVEFTRWFVTCTGVLAPVPRTDRGIATKQCSEFFVIRSPSSSPTAAGGVEASLWGVGRSSAFDDTDRRQRRDGWWSVMMFAGKVPDGRSRLPLRVYGRQLAADTLVQCWICRYGALQRPTIMCTGPFQTRCSPTYQHARRS